MPPIKLSAAITKQFRTFGELVLKSKGEVLLRAGEAPRGAFLIKSGLVEMALAANPKLYPSRRLGCGRVIGLPATFSGEPYSLTAECATNCRLYFIPRQNLLELIQHDPAAGFQIVRILSDEIFQMRKSAGRVPKKTHGKARRA